MELQSCCVAWSPLGPVGKGAVFILLTESKNIVGINGHFLQRFLVSFIFTELPDLLQSNDIFDF